MNLQEGLMKQQQKSNSITLSDSLEGTERASSANSGLNQKRAKLANKLSKYIKF